MGYADDARRGGARSRHSDRDHAPPRHGCAHRGGRTRILAPLAGSRRTGWLGRAETRLALELINRGILPSEHPTRVADHLGTIMLLQDEEMARTLVAQRLAAVDRLPGPERDRLLETLAAWLAHQRHTPKIAAELHVHQQTVRYRIGKLRGLLGDELDTAEGRFELELALRARGALHRQSR